MLLPSEASSGERKRRRGSGSAFLTGGERKGGGRSRTASPRGVEEGGLDGAGMWCRRGGGIRMCMPVWASGFGLTRCKQYNFLLIQKIFKQLELI
jgi:hypothetical protein